MSLINVLRHDIKPTSTVTPRTLAGSSTTPAQVESPVENLTADDDLSPRQGQMVFEQTLPSRTTESRRVAITVLLVLANLVQVSRRLSCNYSGNIIDILTVIDDRQLCRYCGRQCID